MFQFPALASAIEQISVFKRMGYPIGRSPDQRLFAPPRRLSQLITSFIASESQGIPRAPLVNFLSLFKVAQVRSFSFLFIFP